MKMVILLACFVFLGSLTTIARADILFHDNFENVSTFAEWNATWPINANNFSTNYSLSPTHSLWTDNGGEHYIGLNEDNKNDFWVRASIFHTSQETDIGDIFAITDQYDNGTYSGSYDFSLSALEDAGNWSFSEWTNWNSITSDIPNQDNVWTNITYHFIDAFSTDSNISIWINDEYIGELIVTDDSLFNKTNNGYPLQPADIIIDLNSRWSFNTTFSDNICVYNGTFDAVACGFEESCVPSWNCTAWSQCIRGYQTRSCTDLNQCGDNRTKPAESQLCLNPIPNATYNISSDCCPISTFYCTDNETLVQLWNTSQGISWAVQNCPYLCDNVTSSCSPAPFEANLWTLVIIVVIIAAIAVLYRWSRR